MLKNKKLKNTLLILGFSGLMLNNAFAQEENVDFQMSPEQQQQTQQKQQQQQMMQQQQQQMMQQQQQQMMMQQQQMQQYNNSRMSLEEALQLESQITRSKLQQQLNKELKKEIGEPQKIVSQPTINKQNDKKPVITTTNSEPILKSIRGVPGNLKVYISINNITAIGKKGDVIGGWKITKITDSYVILQKNSVKKKLSFYN